MELYILFVSIFGKVEVDNWCQNAYWTPRNTQERTIELCSTVWEEVYFYNQD